MYHNVVLFALTTSLVAQAGLVAADPVVTGLDHNAADNVVPVGIISTSASSIVTSMTYVAVRTSTPNVFTSLTFFTPHPTHPPSVSQFLTQITTALAQASSAVSSPRSPTLNPILNTSPSMGSSPSLRSPPVPSSFRQDISTSVSLLSSALPHSPPTGNANIAPTVRYVLIAVLAGIPTLIVIGFIITLRWRRARGSHGHSDSKRLPENASIGPAGFRERRSARFSSFFSVGHGNGYQERDGRKGRRQLYATSIHSTAGLAGVGAHRGGSDSSVPPMIQYVKLPESRTRAEAENKANFENPFGTPPPTDGGFVIAPSRVSPHIPQTPHLHLVQLPSTAPRTASRDAPGAEWIKTSTFNIGGKTRLDGQSAGPQTKSRRDGATLKQGTSVPPVHDRSGSMPSNSGRNLLSPQPPKSSRRHREPPLLDLRHISPTRASVAPSVYGGIASPRVPYVPTPNMTPTLPYLVPSPISGRTPVLPYLVSPAADPAQTPEPWHTVAPIIVIETASTIDSASEYDDDGTTYSDEEMNGSPFMEQRDVRVAGVAQGLARRDGLVGSPLGYVPPSSTLSTVSSYSASSVSGTVESASSSVSSINRHESSASSRPIISASSSDDSSVTIRAAPMNSKQLRRADGTGLKPRGSLWLPNNFDELMTGKRR